MTALTHFFYARRQAIFLLFASLAPFAHKVMAGGNSFVDPTGRSGNSSLGDILDTIVNVVIFIAFPIIVLMLVYTGFLFVQAQGNPTKLSEARKVFIWTLVGAFIILVAETLKDVIVSTVNELRQ